MRVLIYTLPGHWSSSYVQRLTGFYWAWANEQAHSATGSRQQFIVNFHSNSVHVATRKRLLYASPGILFLSFFFFYFYSASFFFSCWFSFDVIGLNVLVRNSRLGNTGMIIFFFIFWSEGGDLNWFLCLRNGVTRWLAVTEDEQIII